MNAGSLALPDGFTITGAAAGDQLGTSVSGSPLNFLPVGINNDNFPDFIIGAPGNDASADDAGAAYVIYGKANGGYKDLDLSSLAEADGWTITGVFEGDMAGAAVAVLRDDRQFGELAIDSVAIGSPGADERGQDSGAVDVVFGFNAASQGPKDLNIINATSGPRFLGESAGDLLGASLAGFGARSIDRQGPGALEEGLLIGAPGADTLFAIYPQALNEGYSYERLEFLTSDKGAVIQGPPDSGVGRSVAGGLFDYDGDGNYDIVTAGRSSAGHPRRERPM